MRRILIFLGLWLPLAFAHVQPANAYPLGARAAIFAGGPCAQGIVNIDFTKANGQALTCLIAKGAGTFTRNSVKTCTRLDGTITQVPANAPCVTDQGWLVEPAVTNLLTVSTSSSCCGVAFGTVTPTGAQPDPMGGVGGAQLVGTGSWLYAATASVSANTAYTCSWYARASSPTLAKVDFFDGTTDAAQPITVTNVWQRFSATLTTSGTATSARCGIGSASGSVTFTEAFPQVQTGSTPSSWCPTSVGIATCAADALSITFPGLKSSATVSYGAGSTASPSATSPINLGASSGAAWVGSYIKKLAVK